MEPFEQIREFVVAQTGALPKNVHPDTSLFHDLGMDGDDAVEFFLAYEKEFEVDVSELRLTWDRYFGPEGGFNPVAWVWWMIARKLPRFVPITMLDLVASASAGRWIAPDRPPKSSL